MFKIAQSNTYWAEVPLEILNEEGKREKFSFDAQFKRLTTSQLDDIYNRLKDGRLNDQGVLEEVLVGWRKMVEDDGSQIPFNPETYRMVMDIHPVRPATVDAFFRTVNGARTKN